MSTRKPISYRQKAKILRDFGFSVTFGKRGRKATPQSKAAITRTWEKIQKFQNSHRWKFIQATKAVKDRYSTRNLRTPNGFFVQVPKGIPKNRYKIDTRDGNLVMTFKDRRDTILSLDPRELAKDPKGYIAKLLKKHKIQGSKAVHVMVNGWQGRVSYDIDYFEKHYFQQFIKGLRSPDYMGEPKRGKLMTYKAMSDTFHLKIIH